MGYTLSMVALQPLLALGYFITFPPFMSLSPVFFPLSELTTTSDLSLLYLIDILATA